MTRFACIALLLAALLPIGSATAALPADAPPASGHVLYLARRRWHIDVGFAAADLDPSLAFIVRRFPSAKYVFFGFGDRRYLLSQHKGASALAGALFPGAGLVLVTAIENAPMQAFGAAQVIAFPVSGEQGAAAERFVRASLSSAAAEPEPLAAGPYEGSAYYDTAARYSALHTCNTWAAEAMRAAGLPARTRFVIFAGQTWRQAQKLRAQLNR
jgi:hypothetical protein